MNGRNSKVIICKDINLDKEYVNVLDYTENFMLSLCTSSDHLVATANSFSYIRNSGEIQVDFSYEECLSCNYMAFQNPDYSNKWFFAFIDEVEYLGEKNTKIRYTVDEHSTWFDYWDPKTCLVLREHVRDDSIGLHTYPEQLEHGDYICNSYEEYGGFAAYTSKIIIGTTWLPNNTPNLPTTQYYGGVFSGVYYVAFPPYTADAKNFVLALDGLGRGDSIVSAFMAPGSLCGAGTEFTGTLHSNINNDDGTTSPHDFTISGTFLTNTTGAINISSDHTISMQTTLNGYTPRNNKLLCWPYNMLFISNNNGNSAEYHYEDFINNLPTFNITGTICPGCSIKLYPENYKKIGDTTGTHPGFSYGLMAGKFPICSYQNDAFVNYMTQQAVNHASARFNEVLGLGLAIASGGEGGSGNILTAQENYMNEVYQHSLAPNQLHGSLNGADISYAIDEINFSVYKMSIRSEYASMIDDYLTKYGYRINKLKLPDMTSRVYYNYIQIGSQEDIGYSNSLGSVPSSSMEIINGIYRKGTTIWHDHNNIGNYSLNNTIV